MNYERLYEYRFRAVPQEKRIAAWRPIARYIHEALGRPEVVLDAAAGRGEFIESVQAAERWAIDLMPPRRDADHDVRWLTVDVLAAELPSSHFGGVFVSNFLEHLPSHEAVAEFLERMRRVLRPQGRIAILGPNFRYCVREYFDFADHSLVLTDRSIEEHVYAAGLRIVRLESRFLPYSFTGRLPTSPRLVETYLRCPPAWRLLGKQFLAVAERD